MVENRGPATLGVTITLLILATLFVLCRFITRVWIVRRVYLDDWFTLAAWALAVGFSVSICAGTAVGLGLHEADIPDGHHEQLRKAEYAFSVLYNPALMVGWPIIPISGVHICIQADIPLIDDQDVHLGFLSVPVQR